MFSLYLVFFLTLLLVFFLVFWAFQISYSMSQDKIGFLPTLSGKLNDQLVRIFRERIKNPENHQFVELGAGVANISSFIGKKFHFKKIIAVEIDPITIFFGRVLNIFQKTKIEFVRKNIFDYKIPRASIIYCYLGSHILQKLYEQGKLKGHLVISTTFKLEDIQPDEVIEMSNFYRFMYVYDFRSGK